jgi:hypothetical protein
MLVIMVLFMCVGNFDGGDLTLRCDALDLSGRTVTLVEDRSAALLLRVWLEDDTEFRARLTAVDVRRGGEPGQDVTVAMASTPGDALEAVRAWLDEFLHRAGNPVDGGE